MDADPQPAREPARVRQDPAGIRARVQPGAQWSGSSPAKICSAGRPAGLKRRERPATRPVVAILAVEDPEHWALRRRVAEPGPGTTGSESRRRVNTKVEPGIPVAAARAVAAATHPAPTFQESTTQESTIQWL